jgi:hypothetical protein
MPEKEDLADFFALTKERRWREGGVYAEKV